MTQVTLYTVYTVTVNTSTDDDPQMNNVETERTEVERQKKAALFILKAREERLLTQDARDGLLEDITCKYLFTV